MLRVHISNRSSLVASPCGSILLLLNHLSICERGLTLGAVCQSNMYLRYLIIASFASLFLPATAAPTKQPDYEVASYIVARDIPDIDNEIVDPATID